MYETMKADFWQGRVDSHEPDNALRWHQRVRPIHQQDQPGIALLGICCDEGVRRNQGRIGARLAPNAIRHALGSQAWHLQPPLYDAGNLHCDDRNLEQLSIDQARHVQQLLEQGHFPLILGGGHEIALGNFMGLAHFARTRLEGPIGIINFDAHFDLRRDNQPSSGTPFLQIAELCAREGLAFHYACLGVSATANTAALFQRADTLGVRYLMDDQVDPWDLCDAHALIDDFIAPLAALYLTVDLDVLPAAVMPGVSAPAPRGVPLATLEKLIGHIRLKAGSRLRLADLAEYNPDRDIDGQSARVAARLCHRILKPVEN